MDIARLALLIADALEVGDVVFIANDEQRGEAICAAVQAAVPQFDVILVPSSDAFPGDDAPPSPGNAGRRAAALGRLRQLSADGARQPLCCIASAEATAQLYPRPEAFDAAPPSLRLGQSCDLEALGEQLIAIGYIPDDRVDEPGEISVLGDVLDLFPADAEQPVRVEVRNGAIEAIRAYDPVSQLSVSTLERIDIGRAAEPPIGEGVTLLDHLRPASIVFDTKVEARRDRFLALANDALAHGARGVTAVTPKRWDGALEDWNVLDWSADDAAAVPRFVEMRSPLAAFAKWAKPLLATRPLILVGGARDLRFLSPRVGKSLRTEVVALADWAAAKALTPGSVGMLAMPVPGGFAADDCIVVSAADLLGSRAVRDDATAVTAGSLPGGGATIRIGDVVVHEDHGIAVIEGLEPMPEAGDAIVLRHALDARRLVPVEAADRLWRYGADADAVALDKLDGSSWQKRRVAIDAAVAESARGLTELAEARARLDALVVEPDAAAYERLASGFAFTETADQARAIAAIRDDLKAGHPMDRIVVGDVGYGKTEVALRAAAMVALAGGQVAIAAPTTVLVRQHLELFRKRFEGSGVAVATLSRLSTASDKKAVKAGLADGSIGIVIGTGAVASKDISYKNFALVVIDEEQRFGAADKAKLRRSAETHALTLTATPIPRTLQSALVGLQQMSIIATPPARRQPIRTTVDRFDDTRVRTALVREKGRGGQSFVVVPRIEDMEPLAQKLARIAPELSVITAHGKLPPAELDEAMVRFASGHGDVLLATNIIEAGLDVPRANTMIVWRADRFGLSQLHQLRGRVGRGSRRGQILLLTDGEAQIAEATMRRLKTLQAFDRLGAGFAISAHDLDMRGAGDLLGDAQAGHMKLIGVDLYQHLLGSALRRARGETVEHWTPDLKLGLDSRLPESWIPDADIRVGLYGRLARIENAKALDAFEAELEDRFGLLPAQAAMLMTAARVRVLARAADIARIDAGPAAVALTPRTSSNLDFAAVGLTKKGERWILAERIDDPESRALRVAALLEAALDV